MVWTGAPDTRRHSQSRNRHAVDACAGGGLPPLDACPLARLRPQLKSDNVGRQLSQQLHHFLELLCRGCEQIHGADYMCLTLNTREPVHLCADLFRRSTSRHMHTHTHTPKLTTKTMANISADGQGRPPPVTSLPVDRGGGHCKEPHLCVHSPHPPMHVRKAGDRGSSMAPSPAPRDRGPSRSPSPRHGTAPAPPHESDRTLPPRTGAIGVACRDIALVRSDRPAP